MDVLLKILGVWKQNAGHVTSIRPSYHSQVPLLLVLVIAALLIGLTFWLYKRTATYVSPGRRYVLATLRSAFLCALLVLVLNPVLTITVAGAVRQTLLVIVDTSGSMGVDELRTEQSDIVRAGIAKGDLPPEIGLTASYKPQGDTRISRIDLAKAAFRNDKLNLIPRLEDQYDIVAFNFDRTLTEIASAPPPVKQESTAGQAGLSFAVVIGLLAIIGGIVLATFMKPRNVGLIITAIGVLAFAGSLFWLTYLDRTHTAEHTGARAVKSRTEWVDALPKADGATTAIGTSLRDAIARKRGQGAAGILLVTDGVNNSGVNPIDAVKSEEMPLYIWGIGVTTPRDISIPDASVDNVVFVRDEAQVSVQVDAKGLTGQGGKLILKLGDKQVDAKDISFDLENQRVNLKFTPDLVGDFTLTASIEPRADEVIRDNNFMSKHIRVVDTRIKVLQIEESPRWEFKYLQAMLMRDRRVDYKCVLLDADPAVSDQPPYLKQVPSRKDELANYDLIILGDVNPKRLSATFMDSLSVAVNKLGVSFIMEAGRRFSPTAYHGTPIEQMLPVEFDTPMLGNVTTVTVNDKPIQLELTDKGKESDMLKLAEKPEDNLKHWAQLPSIFWTARVARAKPLADVLMVDPDPAKRTRFGKMPVIAAQQYGHGKVLYIGTDNTWRWRKNLNEQDFVRLWGQTVETMALSHLRGESKRTQLTVDHQTYATGDHVNVTARLYREKDYEPITQATVQAFYAPRDAASAASVGQLPFTLYALPDQPGFYRGEFIATKPGTYKWWVETDPQTTMDYLVTNQTIELTHTAMNQEGLTELAKTTKGEFFREETLFKIPDTIQSKSQPRYTTFEVEFGFSPLYFLLIVSLVTSEWIIRKLCQLK